MPKQPDGGDYRGDVQSWQVGPYELYTKEDHWLPQMDYVVNTFFPNQNGSDQVNYRMLKIR
jgi:hypothetical protein